MLDSKCTLYKPEKLFIKKVSTCRHPVTILYNTRDRSSRPVIHDIKYWHMLAE